MIHERRYHLGTRSGSGERGHLSCVSRRKQESTRHFREMFWVEGVASAEAQSLGELAGPGE